MKIKNQFAENSIGIAAFSLMSLIGYGQDKPAEKSEKFFDKVEAIVPIKSFHFNRRTPFHEWNPGLLFKYPLPDRLDGSHISVVEGAFGNSIGDISPTVGTEIDKSIGSEKGSVHYSIALILGMTAYGEQEYKPVDITEIALPQRGMLPDGYESGETKIIKDRKNHTSKTITMTMNADSVTATVFTKNRCTNSNKRPRFLGGPLLKVSAAKHGVGAFLLGTYMPGMGGVVLAGAQFKPGALKRD